MKTGLGMNTELNDEQMTTCIGNLIVPSILTDQFGQTSKLLIVIAQTNITKYWGLCGLNKMYFITFPEAGESKINCRLIQSLMRAIFLAFRQSTSPPVLQNQGPTLTTSINYNYLSESLSQNRVTLEFRVSTYEWRGRGRKDVFFFSITEPNIIIKSPWNPVWQKWKYQFYSPKRPIMNYLFIHFLSRLESTGNRNTQKMLQEWYLQTWVLHKWNVSWLLWVSARVLCQRKPRPLTREAREHQRTSKSLTPSPLSFTQWGNLDYTVTVMCPRLWVLAFFKSHQNLRILYLKSWTSAFLKTAKLLMKT